MRESRPAGVDLATMADSSNPRAAMLLSLVFQFAMSMARYPSGIPVVLKCGLSVRMAGFEHAPRTGGRPHPLPGQVLMNLLLGIMCNSVSKARPPLLRHPAARTPRCPATPPRDAESAISLATAG